MYAQVVNAMPTPSVSAQGVSCPSHFFPLLAKNGTWTCTLDKAASDASVADLGFTQFSIGGQNGFLFSNTTMKVRQMPYAPQGK